jgi:hypothetical protein
MSNSKASIIVKLAVAAVLAVGLVVLFSVPIDPSAPPLGKLLDQVGDIIVGGRGHGIVMFLVIVLIAGILGALGGLVGRGIRALRP